MGHHLEPQIPHLRLFALYCLMAFRDVNWGKVDILATSGIYFNRRFQMFGLVAKILDPNTNVPEVTIKFVDFWHAGASTYMGQDEHGEIWEIVKLHCNCGDN